MKKQEDRYCKFCDKKVLGGKTRLFCDENCKWEYVKRIKKRNKK